MAKGDREDIRQRADAAENFSTITVRVGTLPGRINDIVLNGGRTVRDALIGAEIRGSGYEIRVNGVIANEEVNLEEADTVLLVRRIQGN